MDAGIDEAVAWPQTAVRRVLGEWPHGVLLAFGWGFGFWLWRRLPEVVPVHWDLHLQPNGWGSRALGAFLVPGLATACYLLLLAAVPVLAGGLTGTPRILRQVRFLIPAFLLALQVGLYGHMGLDPRAVAQPSDSGFWLILALFWILLGNLMPRFEMRTRHRTAWRVANRMGGRALVAAGLLQLAFIWLAPTPRLALFLVTTLLAGAVPYLVAQGRSRGNLGEPGLPEPLAQPWLHRNDLLAVLGAGVVLGGLLLQEPRLPWLALASLGTALPLVWGLLFLETRVRRRGEVQRARNWLRGWLILGLAAEWAVLGVAVRAGAATRLPGLVGGVALLLVFTGVGQWTARRSCPEDRRAAWGEGPTLWDSTDPRVLTPKLVGWTFNFAQLAAWLLLVGLLAPLLASSN